jgi:hypothetical protein
MLVVDILEKTHGIDGTTDAVRRVLRVDLTALPEGWERAAAGRPGTNAAHVPGRRGSSSVLIQIRPDRPGNRPHLVHPIAESTPDFDRTHQMRA